MVLVPQGNKKFVLMSHTGKPLSKPVSKRMALKREKQVNFFKNVKGRGRKAGLSFRPIINAATAARTQVTNAANYARTLDANQSAALLHNIRSTSVPDLARSATRPLRQAVNTLKGNAVGGPNFKGFYYDPEIGENVPSKKVKQIYKTPEGKREWQGAKYAQEQSNKYIPLETKYKGLEGNKLLNNLSPSLSRAKHARYYTIKQLEHLKYEQGLPLPKDQQQMLDVRNRINSFQYDQRQLKAAIRDGTYVPPAEPMSSQQAAKFQPPAMDDSAIKAMYKLNPDELAANKKAVIQKNKITTKKRGRTEDLNRGLPQTIIKKRVRQQYLENLAHKQALDDAEMTNSKLPNPRATNIKAPDFNPYKLTYGSDDLSSTE
jgi:hypothetical protein